MSKLLAAAAVLCLLVAPPRVSAQISTTAEWPTFGGSQSHQSRSTSTSPQTQPVNGAKAVWVYDTRAWLGDSAAISSGAVTDGTRIFFSADPQDNSAVYLVAISAETGAKLWHAGLPLSSGFNYPSNTPVVGTSAIFMTGGSRVYAFDPSTGMQLWNATISDLTPTARVVTVPLLAAGNVIAGNENGVITAFNPTTGKSVWSRSFSGPSFTLESAPTSITVASTTLAAFSTNGGYLITVNAATGAPYCLLSNGACGVLGTMPLSSPAGAGQGRNTATVSSDGAKLYAPLDASNNVGISVVTLSTGSFVTIPPPLSAQLSRGALALTAQGYLITYSASQKVFCIDPSNSATRWTYSGFDDSQGFVYFDSAPLVGPDGTVYVREDGASAALHALDSVTGTMKWKINLPGRAPRSSPVIAGGALYIGAGGSMLKLVDSGAAFSPVPFVSSSPAPAGGTSTPTPSMSFNPAPVSGALVTVTIQLQGVPYSPDLFPVSQAFIDDTYDLLRAMVPTNLLSYIGNVVVGYVINDADPTYYFDVPVDLTGSSELNSAFVQALSNALIASLQPGDRQAATFPRAFAAIKAVTSSFTVTVIRNSIQVTGPTYTPLPKAQLPTPSAPPAAKTASLTFTVRLNGVTMQQIQSAGLSAVNAALRSAVAGAVQGAVNMAVSSNDVSITLTTSSSTTTTTTTTALGGRRRELQGGTASGLVEVIANVQMREAIPGIASMYSQTVFSGTALSTSVKTIVSSLTNVPMASLSASITAASGSSTGFPSSVPPPPFNPPSGSGGSGGKRTDGAAIGGAIGGVLLVGAIIAGTVFFVRRRRFNANGSRVNKQASKSRPSSVAAASAADAATSSGVGGGLGGIALSVQNPLTSAAAATNGHKSNYAPTATTGVYR